MWESWFASLSSKSSPPFVLSVALGTLSVQYSSGVQYCVTGDKTRSYRVSVASVEARLGIYERCLA